MPKTIVDLCRDQTAATAIEYGLIAALISSGKLSSRIIVLTLRALRLKYC